MGAFPKVKFFGTVLVIGCLLVREIGLAEPIPVRYPEGTMHAFLQLQTLEGKRIADGESTQSVRGIEVTSRLIFRFLDASIYDDTTVFSQRSTFELVTDHLIQKGPSFKEPTDTFIDVKKGAVTVQYTDKDGQNKVETNQLDLPADLANGLLFTLLKNIPRNVPTTLSLVAASPKPRLVKLDITREDDEPFSVGAIQKQAARYRLKVQIGGIAGAVAHLIGKQPADTLVWILGGSAPAVIKVEGPLYAAGPVWRIEMSEPARFRNSSITRKNGDGH